MPLYPVRALERAMKIKEVITRAMSGQFTWTQAAEIIGITDRSMRRWRKRLSTGGYEDLLDRRTRRPSAKRIDTPWNCARQERPLSDGKGFQSASDRSCRLHH